MSGFSGVAGSFVAATQADQEAASSLTAGVTSGRQHFHPSALKAWGYANQTGTQALNASYNVTSITDGGNGITQFNFTTSMSSSNYSATATSDLATVNVFGQSARAAGSYSVVGANAGTPADSSFVCFMLAGDI